MPAENVTVLIVEDDRFLSPLLKTRFEREHLTVRQAFDGEEALRALEEITPGVIILDLIMPRVSGFELMETIARDPKLNQIPVIILSNLSQDSDIEKAKSLGAVAYFVKVHASIDELVKLAREKAVGGGSGEVGSAATQISTGQ
jgi:DNA-binding response OmpR family regulator